MLETFSGAHQATGASSCNDIKARPPTAFLSINRSLSGLEKDSKLSTPSTPSKTMPSRSLAIVEDFEDITPSQTGANTNLPEPRVLISNARQLRKKPPAHAAPVLAVLTEATSVSVLYGSKAVPSQVWLDLTDAITSIACTMTVSDISQLLKLFATALHRCGRRLNPQAASLSALADGARAAFKSREHSTEELLEFQSAVADVLRVVSLGGAAGTRSVERREWGQAMATKLLPLLSVGTAAVYATYKNISACFSPEDNEHTVQNALFFAEALSTMAWCPSSTVSTEKLDLSSSYKSSSSKKRKGGSTSRPSASASSAARGWERFFCFVPFATNTVSSSSTADDPTTLTPTPSLPLYPQLLSKITSRSATIAQWLEETVAPAALHGMTLQQLDIFTAALVTAAAGDDGKIENNNEIKSRSHHGTILSTKSSKYDVDSASESNSTMDNNKTSYKRRNQSSEKKSSSLLRDILVRCAGDAIEEAATRVINASSCYSTSTTGSSNGDSSPHSPPTTPAYAVSTPNSHKLNQNNNNDTVTEFGFSSPSRSGASSSSAASDEVDVCSARRMAATARRNWEAAASVHSPKAAEVATFARVLEEYVAAREDEEDAAVQAEIAAAAARLELGC
ncbi:hypothetical protein Ndes2526B_g01601 [Nannochloris sp. 'desiccata']|nr:hypothetical protein NADE_002376 [Chlorella desiccata (nom. nud.)]